MAKYINARLRQPRDSKENWEYKNPKLLNGERVFVDIYDENDILIETKEKIGDGENFFKALPYFSISSSSGSLISSEDLDLEKDPTIEKNQMVLVPKTITIEDGAEEDGATPKTYTQTFYSAKVGDGESSLSKASYLTNLKAGDGWGSVVQVEATTEEHGDQQKDKNGNLKFDDNGEPIYYYPQPIATGQRAVALGKYTKAFGDASMAVNYSAVAKGRRSFACNAAITEETGGVSFAANHGIAKGENSSAFGSSTAIGAMSFACGNGNFVTGDNSFVEGSENMVEGSNTHAEGSENVICGSNSHAEGTLNTIDRDFNHAEGYGNTINGNYNHAEGYSNTVVGDYNHCGGQTNRCGDAEAGIYPTASFATGNGNTITGNYSFVSGKSSTITSDCSCSFGDENQIYSKNSMAFGSNNILQNGTGKVTNCFVAGTGLITNNNNLTVLGRYNQASQISPFVVGWGEKEDENGQIYRNNLLELTRGGTLKINTTYQSYGQQAALQLSNTIMTETDLANLLTHKTEIENIKSAYATQEYVNEAIAIAISGAIGGSY